MKKVLNVGPGGNHLAKLLAAVEEKEAAVGKLTGINWVNVAHDDWCDRLRGVGECNCDPEIQFMTIN